MKYTIKRNKHNSIKSTNKERVHERFSVEKSNCIHIFCWCYYVIAEILIWNTLLYNIWFDYDLCSWLGNKIHLFKLTCNIECPYFVQLFVARWLVCFIFKTIVSKVKIYFEWWDVSVYCWRSWASIYCVNFGFVMHVSFIIITTKRQCYTRKVACSIPKKRNVKTVYGSAVIEYVFFFFTL